MLMSATKRAILARALFLMKRYGRGESTARHQFICHALKDAAMDVEKAACDSLSELLVDTALDSLYEFIAEGIAVDGKPGCTFMSWMMDVYPDCSPWSYKPHEDISHMAREAWLAKLLYLADLGAVEVFSNGVWCAKDGTLMTASGKRSVFDDVDQ